MGNRIDGDRVQISIEEAKHRIAGLEAFAAFEEIAGYPGRTRRALAMVAELRDYIKWRQLGRPVRGVRLRRI